MLSRQGQALGPKSAWKLSDLLNDEDAVADEEFVEAQLVTFDTRDKSLQENIPLDLQPMQVV